MKITFSYINEKKSIDGSYERTNFFNPLDFFRSNNFIQSAKKS